MDYTEFLRENDLSNAQITGIGTDSWTEDSGELFSFQIKGDYVNGEYRYFDLIASRIRTDDPELKAKIRSLNDMKLPVLKSVSATEKDKTYYVSLALDNNGSVVSVDFTCSFFSASGSHYRGFDYTNVYGTPEYEEMEARCRYVFDEKYFKDEKITELQDGFSWYERNYIHMSDHAIHARGAKIELRKDGKCIFAVSPCDNHHSVHKEIILHSNGHRYLPFHVDLYGISYIDVDTLEVYNYVPRGYDNNCGLPMGESFIVTRVFYDKATDLVAYEGCYWAGPSDVMVGSLKDPLNFDPHLISLDEILDPDDECYDVDFVSWDEDGITVKVFGDENGTGTAKLSFEDLKKAFETQDKRAY